MITLRAFRVIKLVTELMSLKICNLCACSYVMALYMPVLTRQRTKSRTTWNPRKTGQARDLFFFFRERKNAEEKKKRYTSLKWERDKIHASGSRGANSWRGPPAFPQATDGRSAAFFPCSDLMHRIPTWARWCTDCGRRRRT